MLTGTMVSRVRITMVKTSTRTERWETKLLTWSKLIACTGWSLPLACLFLRLANWCGQETGLSNHSRFAAPWPVLSTCADTLSAFWALYFLCSAIRSSVGLAQTMNTAQKHNLSQVLHLSPRQVSTGLALFYVCYVIFDLPANLIMTRVSPQVWMSRIVIAVGIVGSCMAAMRAAWSF